MKNINPINLLWISGISMIVFHIIENLFNLYAISAYFKLNFSL